MQLCLLLFVYLRITYYTVSHAVVAQTPVDSELSGGLSDLDAASQTLAHPVEQGAGPSGSLAAVSLQCPTEGDRAAPSPAQPPAASR